MADDPHAQHHTGSDFYQQGQNVYGSQYNAGQMHFQQNADPQSIADGLARDRQRWQAQQEALRQRDRQAYMTAERNVMRWTWRILGFTVALFFLCAIVLGVVGSL